MKSLKQKLTFLLQQEEAVEGSLMEICKLLHKEIEYFNWVGFYFLSENKRELILGPYVGAPTEHVKIPIGKGICGQVAVSGETFEVPDVKAQDNYISCAVETQAELVVPIFKQNENIGQIDIDSHQNNPFTTEDKELMEWLCGELGNRL